MTSIEQSCRALLALTGGIIAVRHPCQELQKTGEGCGAEESWLQWCPVVAVVAFDVTQHPLLLGKLKAYGVDI